MPRTLCLLVVLLSLQGLAQGVLKVACYPPYGDALRALLPLWEAQFGVKVQLNVQPYGDHHNTLTTQVATGTVTADVVCVESRLVQQFSASGRFEDLLEAPYHAQEHQHKVTPHAWAEAMWPDGNLFVFPVDAAPGTLFYRQDVLIKAGVTPEDLTESWGTFLAAGLKIKEKTGAFLMHDARFLVQAYLRSTVPPGESLYFDRQGNPTLTSKRFVEAFTLAKKARDLGLDAQVGEWGPEWTRMLYEGKIATQMFGSWFERDLKMLFPEGRGFWRAANLPGNTYVPWGGDFLAVPSQGKQKDLAWEFIQFVALNRAAQLTASSVTGMLPVLNTAQQDRALHKPLPHLGMQVPQPMWAEAIRHIQPVVSTKFDRVAEDGLDAALYGVLEEKKDILQALQEVQERFFHRDRNRNRP